MRNELDPYEPPGQENRKTGRAWIAWASVASVVIFAIVFFVSAFRVTENRSRYSKALRDYQVDQPAMLPPANQATNTSESP